MEAAIGNDQFLPAFQLTSGDSRTEMNDGRRCHFLFLAVICASG
uniref:Uncharacterized protein n=1 Tax=Arundo donax TaxID=35708 RepID=A0A0A9FW35_ARUDO